MTTPFAARDARLSSAIDRAFGESFTFMPQAIATNGDVNLPMNPDAARQAFIATGVWEAPSKSSLPAARGSSSDDMAHAVQASMPSISVAAIQLVWQPRQNDRVIRNYDGALYAIAAALPDGMGRVTFHLTAKKR